MAPPNPQLAKLTIVSGAVQKDVLGTSSWAAVKNPSAVAIVEAVTSPKNDPSEWAKIKWSGDIGSPDKSKTNRRLLPLDKSQQLNIKAEFGGSAATVTVWVISATISIMTSGKRPHGAAPFGEGAQRDGTDNLGAVEYGLDPGYAVLIDETTEEFAQVRTVSGKIAAVATLSPKGISKFVQSGWSIRRQIMSRDWGDGFKRESAKTWSKTWVDDTSLSPYLMLKPDASDQIYDVDAPDLRYSSKSAETYNNFQQWVEWHGDRCSEVVPWSWEAQWQVNRDPKKQVKLNSLKASKITLPDVPHFPP